MDARPARRLPRSSWLLGALAALLMAGGCAELRDAVGGDEATPAPETTSAADAAESATALDSPLPVGAELETRYIGNTGGLGVSLRSDCAADARIAGGWAETTEVHLLESDDGRCEGWSLVEAHGIESWVSELYLVRERPTVVMTGSSAPAPPPGSGDSGSSAGATSPPPNLAAPSASGAAPMIVYGPAAPGTSVLILIDGRPCKTAEAFDEPASATGQLWSTQIQAGECDARVGSSITFALNGAPTNEQLVWSSGGVPPNVAIGVSLTLR